MNRKKALEKRMQRLLAKKQKLAERCNASSDVNEVRELTEALEDVNAEIDETNEELEAIAEEERSAQAQAEKRDAVPANATLVNGNVVGSFAQKSDNTQERSNVLESMEYRQAFKDYVQNGTPIPAEFRNGDAISTNETGTAIPMTIMNEVINTVRKRYGNLYSKVRKLNIKGGVEFPIGALQASFKWINESTVSPRQKTDKLGKVSFNYHTAEIRIAQTFLSQILTLSSFEQKITEIIAVAYLEVN